MNTITAEFKSFTKVTQDPGRRTETDRHEADGQPSDKVSGQFRHETLLEIR